MAFVTCAMSQLCRKCLSYKGIRSHHQQSTTQAPDFVEVVWGDGATTNRQIISTTDLPPFGSKAFSIPFDATGKDWVRVAAWDSAMNGAVSMPVRLRPQPAPRR